MLLGLVLAALAMATVPVAAAAEPVLDLDSAWGDANLQPGGIGEFVLQAKNLGDTATDGSPVEVTLELPPGVTRLAPLPGDSPELEGAGWSCSGAALVSCTRGGPFEPRTEDVFQPGYAPRIYIRVAVDPLAIGTYPVAATLSGGGVPVPAVDSHPVTIGAQGAGFGVVPGTFRADVWNGEYPFGARARQAGSHPFELRVNFDFNLKNETKGSLDPAQVSPESWTTPDGHVRNIEQTLPQGLIGNPEATPKCRNVDFVSPGTDYFESTGCPPDTQVGVMDLDLGDGNSSRGFGAFYEGGSSRVGVYNLVPPKGVPADFGFQVAGVFGHIYPSLDPAQGYAIKASVPYNSDLVQVRHARFTMWGVPGDPAHDHLRFHVESEGAPLVFGAPFKSPIKPLLTLSSECGSERHFQFRADAWGSPDNYLPTLLADPGTVVDGCDDPRFRFNPEVALQPTSRAAGGPTGLQVDLKVPQRDDTVTNANSLYDQSGDVRAIATSPLKRAVVTMPEGMTISTSAAQGLGNCSPAQIGLGTDSPVTCPEDSQYGSLTIKTPILPKDEPMTGRIYVAKQNENPFNNFLSLYLVIQDVDRGILIKIPGKVDLDPVTGQIKTTFDDLPQFPVSNMQLSLKGGVRAALVNPSTCGTKTITAEFTPWNEPGRPVTSSSSYEVRQKPDGSPCVNSLGERPFGPQMSAGTISNSAGSYSPFVFRTTRTDDDQEFSRLDVNLPKGLLANISGIAKCSAAAIAAADAPGRTGTEEKNNPSCPASSLIGSSDVGSGVGQVLTYIPGKVYLAGPYKGAPLSMVVITPIVAGPYDLGVIAVRSKIDVNTETTRASVSTDPFPQIFKGIPVRIRDIRVNVDRARTIINPTSCDPMAIGARLTGTGGDVNTTTDDTAADLSSRFQASNCENLPFKPKLSFKLKGGTNRGDYPAFTATLRGRPGDANIARTAVTLPHSEFLAQEHIRTVCTRIQFAAKACPEASIYGYAKATSPLFDGTLEGPVYLRSSSNPLPDLVATLNGEIDVVLSGRIDSVNAQIRNTFDVVPDAPVSTFTLSMQGGKKGLLVNSRNLCKSPARADVKMVGQNGKRSNSKPLVANGCKKKAKKAKKKSAAKGKRGKR